MMTKNFLSLVCWLLGLVLLDSCRSMDRAIKNDDAEQHQAQVHSTGTGMIYVDEIPCSNIMREEASESTCFRCYTIGFIDSLSLANTGKNDTEAGKYYQYEMQNDWTVLVNGDSLKPVFFHPRQRLEGYRHEGVLVFETPKDERPGVLLYDDSYSSWGIQQFVINNSKK